MECDFINCRYYMNGECTQTPGITCRYRDAKGVVENTPNPLNMTNKEAADILKLNFFTYRLIARGNCKSSLQLRTEVAILKAIEALENTKGDS